MLINSHAANGSAPQLSFAVVYKDLATWEATQANLNGTADWDRFRKALAANGTLVSETVYTQWLVGAKSIMSAFLGKARPQASAIRQIILVA